MRPPVAAGDIWDKGRRVCFQAGYLGAHISGRKRSVVEARQGQEKENSQRRPVLFWQEWKDAGDRLEGMESRAILPLLHKSAGAADFAAPVL